MEGYFPVYEYAEMTGLSHDTVYHRAIRGSVEAFKNKEGRWFIYYCEDEIEGTPENYLTFEEFAQKYNLARSTVSYHIRKGKIDPQHILIIKSRNHGKTVHKRKRIYIRKDYDYTPVLLSRKQGRDIISEMDKNRPGSQWMTITEWAEKEGVQRYRAYYWVMKGIIASAMREGHYYIPIVETKEFAKNRMKERRKEQKEWLRKMKQVV